MSSFGNRADQTAAVGGPAAGIGSDNQRPHGEGMHHGREEYPRTIKPSEQAPPTVVNAATQQAYDHSSTQPGDGHEVHVGPGQSVEPAAARNPNLTESGKVPFKEQVIGVAKKIRGTLLDNAETKEHGQQILEGKVNHTEPPL